MVRIRLRRVGAKKQPSYRVVAADKESPRDGRFLEVLGFYNPRTEPSTINFTEDRVYHWLSVGAQPSDAVRRLFDQVGLWDRYQRFKDGEDVAKLVEEAAAEEARAVDPRTRRDDLIGQKKKAEKPAKDEESVEAAEAVEAVEDAPEAEEPQVEQEEPVVDEVEEEAEAEEAEETPEAEEAEEVEEAPEVEEEVAEAEEAAEEDAAEEEADAEEEKE